MPLGQRGQETLSLDKFGMNLTHNQFVIDRTREEHPSHSGSEDPETGATVSRELYSAACFMCRNGLFDREGIRRNPASTCDQVTGHAIGNLGRARGE